MRRLLLIALTCVLAAFWLSLLLGTVFFVLIDPTPANFFNETRLLFLPLIGLTMLLHSCWCALRRARLAGSE